MHPRISQKKNQGMALIAVIFIMIIMSGAVLMMSKLADMQSAERTMDLLGARAQFSAQSGLEWAMYEILTNSSCPTSPTTLTMDSETDLSGFSVVVTCTARPYDEGLTTVTVYDVTSEASISTFSTTGEYVFRRLSAVVEFES